MDPEKFKAIADLLRRRAFDRLWLELLACLPPCARCGQPSSMVLAGAAPIYSCAKNECTPGDGWERAPWCEHAAAAYFAGLSGRTKE